jgi:hypothetical protein
VADPSEKKSSDSPIIALTSIVVALAGVLAHQLNPLDSPRPAIPDSKSAQYFPIQDINARLWQDPFNAILQHEAVSLDKNKATEDKHSINALIKSIVDKSSKMNLKKITVLGVMVPGGAYAEDIEDRRRTRYAVLSGLAVKEYAPEDREHIGYVEHVESLEHMDRGHQVYVQYMGDLEPVKREYTGYVEDLENKDNLKSMPEKIPFEWFNSTNTFKDDSPVLVLWLDDAALGYVSNPLQMTGDFVERVNNAVKKAPKETTKAIPRQLTVSEKTIKSAAEQSEQAPNLNFKFIGPASSNTLQAMIDELAGSSPKEEYPFEFYRATASGDWPGIKIPANSEENKTKIKNIRTYLESLKLPLLITKTSFTDYELAETLAKELERRGFKINKDSDDPREHEDHIVIISEWDTIFGRLGLPKAMKQQFVPMEKKCSKQEKNENKCDWPPEVDWIHSFSYMRGLDGVIPGAEKKTEEAKANKDKDPNNSTKINLESPEGQSQQDYVRRLAEHIDEIKQQLENNDSGEIKAIGVLGSDSYDKLMILKALRPSFPKAVFFTTDLDARLMQSKDFDVIRNLVVAASFDLKLAENLQKSIPPFRDSYQTAHFLATQIALDNANGKKLDQGSIEKILDKPRLFETGNNKVIPLNPNKKAKSCATLQNCENVHPPVPPRNKKIDLLLGISPFLIIGIACFFSKKCQSYLKDFNQFVKECLVFDLKLWRLICPCETVGREPIKGTQVAICLVPQLLVLYVVIMTISVIHSEILLGDDGEPFFWNAGISVWPSEIIRLFAGILSYFFIVKTISDLRKENEELAERFYLNEFSGEVVNLWKDYNGKISNSEYIWMIMRYSAVFLSFAGLLFWVFGLPSVPFRGEASSYANTLVLLFSVPLFIILVMTVFQATLHSINLITELDKSNSVWPQTLLRHWNLKPEEDALPRIKSTSSSEVKFNYTFTKLQKKLYEKNKYYLNEWLDIEFIAEQTKMVGKLVYYPFIILALMIFARSKMFDNWDMPISLVIVLLSAVVLTLGSAFSLRRAAERTRKNALKNISSMKMALACQPDSDSPANKAMEKQIDLALAKIQEIKEGAFQPLTNDPAFQAFLIPFGSFGGVALLEALNGLL